jgi:hypothetical protein
VRCGNVSGLGELGKNGILIASVETWHPCQYEPASETRLPTVLQRDYTCSNAVRGTGQFEATAAGVVIEPTRRTRGLIFEERRHVVALIGAMDGRVPFGGGRTV